MHPQGACPLKIAGVEYCGLCGLAHYGIQRVCPHLNSETQVREMINAVRNSAEPPHVVEAAMKYLRGLKGNLVQAKKKKKEKAMGIVPGPGPGQVVSANAARPAYPLSGSSAGQAKGQNGGAKYDEGVVAEALLGYLGH